MFVMTTVPREMSYSVVGVLNLVVVPRVAAHMTFRSRWRTDRHRSHCASSARVVGKQMCTRCGNFRRRPMSGVVATRTSESPTTHLINDRITFVYLGLTWLVRRIVTFPRRMEIFSRVPGATLPKTVAAGRAYAAVNAGMCFDLLAAAKVTLDGKKRKRGAPRGVMTPYNVQVAMLMAQPTDCTGQPIKLCKSVIRASSAAMFVVEKLGIPVITETGPIAVPIATVDDDNEQLVFGRVGIPQCSSGIDCIAHMILGAPCEPLGAYRGPGHDADSNDCLLCIRHHIGMMVQMHRANDSRPPVGILPPFCNPVNVNGGYRESFCGVTPADTAVVSGGVHIVGSPIGFRKVYNPYTKIWCIDQSAAVFGTSNFFF